MAVNDKDYASHQDIREEAGQQHVSKLEGLSGTADGNNKDFYTQRTYIVDRDYNDTLDVGESGDVIVYDDSVAVSVASIDATTGKVTLTNAPASSSTMLGTYAHSPLNNTLVGKRRTEAIGYALRRIKGILAYTDWSSATDIPEDIKTFVRLYAGALILIRDQGLTTDSELTSKDGYEKLKLAKKMLMDFVNEVKDDSDSTASVSVSTKSDGNLFDRNTDLSEYNASVDPDGNFMNKDN